MIDLKTYRASAGEEARTADLLNLLPTGRRSVLDVGARDGHFSRLLTEHFQEVTALDLEKPSFEIPRVVTVAGNATRLEFADDAFDCVFCAEVLEHIPDVSEACSELTRVAKYEIIIGVPFRQDTRIGRTTCASCGRRNPPWGHVNTFDESRIASLFPECQIVCKSFAGSNADATNRFAAFLMDIAGNPWGTYDQEEPCIHCGTRLIPAAPRRLYQRACSAVALRINAVQTRFARSHPNWLHLVLSKRG